MDESILTSTKKILGIAEDYEHFDPDIILCINSVLSILTQLGVGPKTGFSIHDKTTKWGALLGRDGRLEMVKTYVHLRVKILFDPPQNASLANVLNEEAKEYEWRIMIAADQAEKDLGPESSWPVPGEVEATFQLPIRNEPPHRDTIQLGRIAT